jgi:alpha-ribazole phosphatase
MLSYHKYRDCHKYLDNQLRPEELSTNSSRDLLPGRRETRFWWVRHAPFHSYGARIYGQLDLDCDCFSSQVFAGLSEYLPKGSVWVTSNLRRTHQTAAAILRAGSTGPAAIVEPAFSEQNLGSWQGLTREEIVCLRKSCPHSVWLAPAAERPEGGESFEDLIDRVREGVSRLTTNHSGCDIIVVAHAGTIRAALAIALELPSETALSFQVENCSVTRLDYLGSPPSGHKWRISYVNHRPWTEFV